MQRDTDTHRENRRKYTDSIYIIYVFVLLLLYYCFILFITCVCVASAQLYRVLSLDFCKVYSKICIIYIFALAHMQENKKTPIKYFFKSKLYKNKSNE